MTTCFAFARAQRVVLLCVRRGTLKRASIIDATRCKESYIVRNPTGLYHVQGVVGRPPQKKMVIP